MRRFFLFLFVLGGTIWMGASLARMMVGYDVFIPGTLSLKDQPELVRLQTIRLYTLMGAWTGWAFAVCALGGVGTMISTARLFRTHGWLLMCSILLVLVMPVQAWIAWEDYRLYMLFDRVSGAALAPTHDIIQAFLTRQQHVALNISSGMALMAAFTIILFATFRPLQKPHEGR